MQANSQLLTPEITTSITGTNHVCRATKPTERIILMLPLQKSVCEPHPGSVERIGSSRSGPSRPQFVPQRQSRPVRLLHKLVSLGRAPRAQDRPAALVGTDAEVEMRHAEGHREVAVRYGLAPTALGSPKPLPESA